MADKKDDIVLSIRGMSKSFGRNRVLDHINLDVKRGTVMGLMGENGAGKSTMMKCPVSYTHLDVYKRQELVTKNEPDLLLTDIRMPFISGLELARQVREVRPSTQIAFLSGYDDFSYAQEAIRYNIISYLLKPISLEELSENLRQIKEKLDRIFSEFSERRRTGPDVAEFLLPLLLDGSQAEASGDREKREARLMEQAVACRFLEPVLSLIHI